MTVSRAASIVLPLVFAAAMSAPRAQQGSDRPTSAPSGPKIARNRVDDLLTAMGQTASGEELLARAIEQAERSPMPPPRDYIERFSEAFDHEAMERRVADVFVEWMPARAADSAIEFFGSEAGTRWLAIDEDVNDEAHRLAQERVAKVGMAILAGQEIERAPEIETPRPGTKEALLHRAIRLLRMPEQMKQSVDAEIEAMKQSPSLPAGLADRIAEYMTVDRLLGMTLPLYLERADEETLQAVVDWASSDEGRAFNAAMLEIVPRVSAVERDIIAAANRAAEGG